MLRRWLVAGVLVGILICSIQIVDAPTAFAATGTTSTSVNVMSGPGYSNAQLGTIAANTTVTFSCFVAGEPVSGNWGTEDIWDALDSGGYVPDALVYTGSNGAIVPACPSDQFGVGTYPVAWTGGSGVQPVDGTSTSASPVGGILPDGQLVNVTCETSGQTVTDSDGFTDSLWDQLSSGGYVPNVYIDTELNAPTPGLSACPQPSGGNGGGGNGSGAGAPSAQNSPETPPSSAAPTAPASSPPPQAATPTGDISVPSFNARSSAGTSTSASPNRTVRSDGSSSDSDNGAILIWTAVGAIGALLGGCGTVMALVRRKRG